MWLQTSQISQMQFTFWIHTKPFTYLGVPRAKEKATERRIEMKRLNHEYQIPAKKHPQTVEKVVKTSIEVVVKSLLIFHSFTFHT